MSNTAELKASGFVEYTELVELVAKTSSISPTTARDWLQRPLTKLRAVLMQADLIILPDDREWNCLYSYELQYFLSAYMRWHRFGTRHSVASVVEFYNDFLSGHPNAMRHLSRSAKRRYNKMLNPTGTDIVAPGQIGGVTTSLRLVAG